jgi:hypothetical protein
MTPPAEPSDRAQPDHDLPVAPELLEVLAGALQQIRADRVLVDVASDAARGPAVGKALPRQEVERHLQAILDAMIAGLLGSPDQAAMLAVANGLAADRAVQGVSLGTLLTGVQRVRSIILEGIIAHAHGQVPADRLLTMLPLLDSQVSALITQMVVIHQEAERALARTAVQARVETLRRLMDTGSAGAAEELGLDPRGRYRCLVVDASTPRQARAVDAALVTADGVSGLVNGYLCRVTSVLPAADRLESVLVVASPPVPVADLPEAHRLCRQGVDLGRAGGHTGLHALTDDALELAVAAQPLLGRMLADSLLAGLDPADAFHRQLAETAAAYLANGGRLDATAAALHVHPNTVAHRLRRLTALTGFSADGDQAGLGRTLRWWWALRTWLAGS